MTCDRLIRDGSLVCIRLDVHTTHVFQASDAPDRHDLTEAVGEE